MNRIFPEKEPVILEKNLKIGFEEFKNLRENLKNILIKNW